MSAQLKQSVKEIVPGFNDVLPPQVVSFIESLYSLSLQERPNLPQRSEIGRYHICTYLAIERFQHIYELPEPDSRKIPIQPKVAEKVLNDFRVNIMDNLASNASTPRRGNSMSRGSNQSTPLSTPSRSRLNTRGSSSRTSPIKMGSPLKRLKFEESKTTTPRKKIKSSVLADEESPFNTKSQESTPETPSTPTIYKYDKKHISIVDFILFANNFHIPASITPRLLEHFLANKVKFGKKSEWLLGCGVIHAVYIRINHKLLRNKVDAKTQFQNQLFQYQKGGLMKWNMILWCTIIEDAIKNEPWIKEIEEKYVYGSDADSDEKEIRENRAREGPGWNIFRIFGSMLVGGDMNLSESQDTYYSNWTTSVLSQVD